MNLRALKPVFLLGIALIAASCGDDDDSPTGPDLKAEVQAAHIGYLQAFLDQDAERFAARLAPGAVDLGGGATGTGEIRAELFTVAYWDSVFDTAGFDSLVGDKSVEDVVDLTTTRVLTKAEAESEYGPDLGDNTAGFRMQSGDMLAFTEPAEGSFLTEPWGGVYRKLDGLWRVIATD